jgi:hypothetical protein
LPVGACEAPPDVDRYPAAELPVERPPATHDVLEAMDALGSPEYVFDAGKRADQYLAEIGEGLPLYHDRRIAHPGFLIRAANTILASNVRLGPWIHVSSDVRHFSLVRDGDVVSARGHVTRVFERKGHEFVDLDVLLVANETRPAMQIAHTAIYAIRRAG